VNPALVGTDAVRRDRSAAILGFCSGLFAARAMKTIFRRSAQRRSATLRQSSSRRPGYAERAGLEIAAQHMNAARLRGLAIKCFASA
jgi:hypothetical protein